MKTINIEEIPNFEETEFGMIISALNAIGVNFSEDGPWIAGGSVLKTLINVPLGDSDIDIFPHGQYQLQTLQAAITNNLELRRCVEDNIEKQYNFVNKNGILKKTEFSLSFNLPYDFQGEDKTRKVQFVTLNASDHIHSKLLSFDINVCRVYFNGKSIVTFPETFEWIEDREMNVDVEYVHNPYFTFKRILKYSKVGFKMSETSITEFFTKFFKEEFVKKLEDYRNSVGTY